MFLFSYSGWGDVVFDDAVEVDAASFWGRRWGAVVEEVPGFAVGLPPIAFVAGEDSDAIIVGRHRGRNDIPDVFRNAVDSQVIEIGFLVITPGASMGVAQDQPFAPSGGSPCGRARQRPIDGAWPQPRSAD